MYDMPKFDNQSWSGREWKMIDGMASKCVHFSFRRRRSCPAMHNFEHMIPC